MTESTATQRIAVMRSPEARAELRAIDREIALQLLHCVDHYLANRTATWRDSNRRAPASACAVATTVFFDQNDETPITSPPWDAVKPTAEPLLT